MPGYAHLWAVVLTLALVVAFLLTIGTVPFTAGYVGGCLMAVVGAVLIAVGSRLG